MITLVKLIITFSLSLVSDSAANYEPIEEDILQSQQYTTILTTSETPKEKAFLILENKCNVCHTEQNKRRVFTQENMDVLANDVYKQVFIKKRMPKGKKIKLTSQEYQNLPTWISTTQNKQNGNQL